MKIILQDNRRYVLRFDKGEEIMAGLKEFMKAQSISGCAFNGIGACALAELAYFDLHTKEYNNKKFSEEMEIVSLIGNSSLKDGQPIIHAHGVLSKNDFSTVGGHLVSLVVSATCEIFLINFNGSLNRKLDGGLNLNLLV